MLAIARRALWSGAAQVMSRPFMRPVVRVLTDLHVALYRRSGGRAQAPGHPTLLLTVTGRRTGQPRTVPLVYVEDGEDLIVAAAYAGSDRDPAWRRNLRHDPAAVAEISRRRIPVRAEPVSTAERDVLWRRLVAMYPPFCRLSAPHCAADPGDPAAARPRRLG
jgi:F420H(2)-dependent quinone reductase